MKRIIIVVLLVGLCRVSSAQLLPPEIDSTYSLLSNAYVQMEATQAINDMYNFRFERSLRHFNYLKKQYGWHPLPYFMMGLNYWWRIVPNFRNETFDDTFYAYMDTAIVLAQRLHDEHNPVEGAFFLSAAYAFKGRLYSERHDWGRAAAAGKNAMNYLEECRGQEDLSPELLFGDALFNYYAEWIPENYPLLKPIMLMFPDGDKELGIQQLKEVARNAFYTRTEAQYFLMRITALEEQDVETAMQVAEYLHRTFPGNAYFHRFYARLLYTSARYRELVPVCESILEALENGEEGYEANSGRYAAFFLGHVYRIRRDYDQAIKYYEMAKSFGEEAEATDMGYYIYSVVHLARIANLTENYEDATTYYEQVKDITKRRDDANKEAREQLKKLKKL
ncbi:M48 family metallopeptidase [Marinoscillum sp. MHG1-6]|uniref:tetratricopeptide repeat protein n=1 Tax=Marinoscillum sp. MHG1-6 TaxID=2959627 RepID=UPI00215712D7|nr:tetratricopeptide repeat protein [Marinoscillum sp. MHG1-6]